MLTLPYSPVIRSADAEPLPDCVGLPDMWRAWKAYWWLGSNKLFPNFGTTVNPQATTHQKQIFLRRVSDLLLRKPEPLNLHAPTDARAAGFLGRPSDGGFLGRA
jgi:hypothetical protein